MKLYGIEVPSPIVIMDIQIAFKTIMIYPGSKVLVLSDLKERKKSLEVDTKSWLMI